MATLIQHWLNKLKRKIAAPHWRYIVWHTAAHGNPKTGDVYNTTAEQINRWHRAQGWNKIGYHFVIQLDGTIEEGRTLDEPGAHTRGLNRQAIGICFSGHGDLKPLTEAQRKAGIALTAALCQHHHIPPHRVIGHREVNDLINAGVLSQQYRVQKTCPGKLVDMRDIRTQIMEVLNALQK